MVDYYGAAIDSFQAHLKWIGGQGQASSREWQLVNGLLQLAQGLRQEYLDEEERRKGFARSERPKRKAVT